MFHNIENEYKKQINKNRINNLISSLKKYNIKRKSEVKLIMDYFNNNKLQKTETNFTGWIVSATLTIALFIEITYNSETQTIDLTKISVILGSSIWIILYLLLLAAIIKLIINSIFLPKNKLYEEISEDLTYIYINFDKFKYKFSK